MTDAIDRDQANAERHLANALQRHAKRPVRAGSTHCENQDCGEPIAAPRQAMGARLCVVCAKAEESRAAHFSAWRTR